ncbi:MAG: hypothetical protein ACJ798_06160 [Phenylobacterium sp.]
MNIKRFMALGLAAGATAGLLASCASEQPGPAQRLAARPAPSAPAPASRDGDLIAQASAFESYMRHARAIEPDFSGPGDVAQAVQAGARHAPVELESGMVAYAALAALQEPRFVAAVRADKSGDLARRIAADPRTALTLPGGEAAGARASGALYAQGSALAAEGQKVKRASYSIQHQAWSKGQASDHAAELARVKRAGQAGYQPERGDGEHVAEALSESGRRGGPASPLVTHGVALAALSLLGQEGRGRGLASDVHTGSCLRIAKLNYHQCLASAGPHYEDIYCLGQHAMIDPGQCVVEATEVRTVRIASAPARPAVTRASYRR